MQADRGDGPVAAPAALQRAVALAAKLASAALLIGAAASAPAAEPAFRSFALAADGSRLEYTTSAGVAGVAPRLGDQRGFAMVRISDDGRYLGWLALHAHCCTSYAIPLALVVLGPDRQLHEFQGAQATFGWCFAHRGRAVAYRRALLHGPSPDLYELRRIDDGKLLATHEVAIDAAAEGVPANRLPAWARCAAP